MNTGNKSVLLIEDNADNRYLATLLLQDEGFGVVVAEDGMKGLAAAAESQFAFVLLDLQLPDLDGFEVARRIRELRTSAQLPIIAVSAFAMATDRRRAFAAGCNGYLEKPIEPETFVAQVRCLTDSVPLS